MKKLYIASAVAIVAMVVVHQAALLLGMSSEEAVFTTIAIAFIMIGVTGYTLTTTSATFVAAVVATIGTCAVFLANGDTVGDIVIASVITIAIIAAIAAMVAEREGVLRWRVMLCLMVEVVSIFLALTMVWGAAVPGVLALTMWAYAPPLQEAQDASEWRL